MLYSLHGLSVALYRISLCCTERVLLLLCLAVAAEERHGGLSHSLPLLVLMHAVLLYELLPFIGGPPTMLHTPAVTTASDTCD